MERPFIPPYLAMFIGVVAVSTSAIFVKLSSAPPPIVAVYRLLFSVLFMLPFLFVFRGSWREIGSMTRRQWGLSVLSGVFLASHFLLWFESLRFTSVASSTVLVTLQPLFAFVGGYLIFRERISRMGILGGFIAIVGSFIIGWGDFRVGGTALWGDVLALLGAFTVTVYWLIGQYARKGMSLYAYTLIVYSVCSVVLVLYALALGFPLAPYPAEDWLWFVSLALIPTLLGHTIFNWLIKWMSTSTISMSILGEPVGTAILAYFILGETVTLPQFVGGAVILFGIYLFIRYQASTEGATVHESSTAKNPA